MSKTKSTQNIGQRRTKTKNNREKERPIKQEGASNKALDPQRSHRTTFKSTSQVAKNKVQGNG